MKKIFIVIFIFFALVIFTTKSVFANSIESIEYKDIVNHVNKIYKKMDMESKKALSEKLYEEKKDPKNQIDDKTRSIVENQIRISYEKMQKEEDYIVFLINSIENKKIKTNKQNWNYNLNFLEKKYKYLSKIKNIEMKNINSYIESYRYVKLNRKLPKEKEDKKTIKIDELNYNKINAVDYANKFYENYNPEYPNWSEYGGDCANFISQCIYNGGKRMSGNAGSEEESENFSNWFSFGNQCSIKNVSSTWRGADAFGYYWRKKAKSYKKFSNVSKKSRVYGYKGDVVSLINSNERVYHTMIIVGYSKLDFILAAHDKDTNNASLKSKTIDGEFIIYNMS